MKKVLVTGANGLVGYEIVKVLNNLKKFDVFRTYHSQNNKIENNVVQIDLESNNIENLNICFDYIIHCAARIPNKVYSDKQVAYINRRIDDNVINYCRRHRCKLVYISGTSVYGSKSDEEMNEESIINTESRYVSEKRNTEIRIINECNSYCILRISSPYGYRQKNDTVLKKFIKAACTGKNLYYYGSGERTQNFISVEDVSYAVVKSMNYKKNAIFNIASQDSISMKRLAVLVLESAKKEFQTESKVQAANCIDDQENVRIYISTKLAQQELGWKQHVNLEEGVRKWIKKERIH